MKQKNKFKVDQEMAKWYFEQGQSQAIADVMKIAPEDICVDFLAWYIYEYPNVHPKQQKTIGQIVSYYLRRGQNFEEELKAKLQDDGGKA